MEQNLAELIPDPTEGWAIEGKDRIYGPDILYEYIDGAAELFLSYNFQQMMSRIYTAPDQPDILLDIFDMGTSQNAYGVFSYSRETEDTLFGQGSQYVSGLLLFWKGRFYVSILFTPETDKAKQTAFHIARHIESSIRSEGALPDIINLLPEVSLLKETIRYFRNHIWINSYYFISNENILHINDQTEVVLAKYDLKERRTLLLLVHYPEESDAKKAVADFIQSYHPELAKKPIVQKEDKWIGCRLEEKFLIVVFNGTDKESVQNLIEKVQHKLNE